MINFPCVPAGPGLPVPKMRLRDYARFSEQCVKSNPSITPENCLAKRAAEATMTQPFSLRSPGKAAIKGQHPDPR